MPRSPWKSNLTSTLVVASLLIGARFAVSLEASENHVAPQIVEQLESWLSVEDLSLEPVLVPAEPMDMETIVVALDGLDHGITLERHSIRSGDFMVTIDGNEEIRAPEVRTYLGTVDGVAGSTVVASLLPDGELRAIIELDADSCWGVQQVPARFGLDPAQHAIFRLGDILPQPWACALPNVDSQDAISTRGIEGAQPQRGQGTADTICEIACDADFPFFVLNGSSIEDTIFDIEFVLHGVADIFRRDVGITYEITLVNVWTSAADPYTSTDATTLLNEFSSYWSANFGSVPRQVAHLFTGTVLDSSTVVSASPSVTVCDPVYALSRSRYTPSVSLRRGVTAHGLGHNWGANHCVGPDCRIMCNPIGGCSGDVSKFGTTSKILIDATEAVADCVAPQPDAVTLPFTDTLDSIDQGRWSWILGAEVNALGSNEPSPTDSFNLDAIGSGLLEQDVARTNWVNTAGANAVASYWVEMRGLDPGESLIVRYWSSSGHWETVNEIVSSGLTEDHYRFHVHSLPPNARHDNFRLEFATTADDPAGDIFIDNVNIADAEVQPGLILDQVTTTPGGQITFSASVQNLTGMNLTAQTAWIDVFAPDGSPLFGSGNPKFGPKTFNLNASATKTKSGIRINVPGSASLGTHQVVVYVGSFPDQVSNALIATFVVQ